MVAGSVLCFDSQYGTKLIESTTTTATGSCIYIYIDTSAYLPVQVLDNTFPAKNLNIAHINHLKVARQVATGDNQMKIHLEMRLKSIKLSRLPVSAASSGGLCKTRIK